MLPLREDAAPQETMSGVASATATETAAEAGGTATKAANEAKKNDEDGMASSAERMTILRMIEQGKISAEDGARLLTALGDRQEAENKPRAAAFDTSHHLQVRVTDLMTNRQKVNVTVPAGLLRLALRWLPVSAKVELEQVQVAIDSGAIGRLVDVVDQDSGVRVEITML
jgi:hypothetical protein